MEPKQSVDQDLNLKWIPSGRIRRFHILGRPQPKNDKLDQNRHSHPEVETDEQSRQVTIASAKAAS